VRLDEVAGKPQYGWTSAARQDATGPPLLRTTDITHGPIEWAAVPKCVKSPPELGRYQLADDDIVVSRAGSVGASALIVSPPRAVFASYLMRLRPGPKVLPKYVRLFLESPGYWKQISEVTNGIALPNINGTKLAAVRLPLPPTAEQRRIVEILEDHLSRLDAAAAQVEAVRQRLETWKRLALDQLVREQASGTIRLADLVVRVEAGRSFGGTAPPAGPDEWGIIKVSAMTWGSFKGEENKTVPADKVDPRYEIQSGDVLVSRANTTEYVGAPVLVRSTRPRLLLSDKSLRIIPKPGVDRSWLVTVLGARSTRRQISHLATGTKDSMRNISQSSLLSVEVPVANAAQQREVIARAAMIEERAAQLGAELSEALFRGRVLRRALLTSAFSGRLTR